MLYEVITLLIIACSSNDVYFQYADLPEAGWNKDSLYRFDVDITDTTSAYNLYVNVRNRGEYPHQNLWLFIKETNPEKVTSRDTINFFLADESGKWLGSGVGAMYEMPVLFRQNVHFPKSGLYRFEIIQGMRDSILSGIGNVGLRVEKVTQ